MDLLACEKIKISNERNSLQTDWKSSQLFVHVVDPEPTYTFMDRVVFQKILQHYERSGGKPRSLEYWLRSAPQNCCVTAALNNLVSRSILGSGQSGVFGMFRKHPTLNIGPLQELEGELKAVGLKERRPDSYMLALLTLSLTAQNYYSFVDPILEKHFTRKEYRVAKENIKTIVETQGVVCKSPKFTRKKFSFEVPQKTYTKLKLSEDSLEAIPGSPNLLRAGPFQNI